MNQDNGKFTRENHSAEHGDSDAWCGRGIALYISGRYEEALQACDKALELNPDNSKAWSNKGKVLRCLGRSEDALQAFDKAIELDPNDSKNWDNKGAALCDFVI